MWQPLLFLLLFVPMAFAQKSNSVFPTKSELISDELNPFVKTKSDERKWVNYYSYVPQDKDYSFEIGSMWEENSLYWLSGRVGFHVGRCILTQSQTCQNYWDVMVGVGGREGQTNGLLLTGLRWQYINFPSHLSPSISVFAGVENISDETRDKNVFAYGVGYGILASVHERVDLGVQVRVGGGDELWSQASLVVGLRVDKWVDYFSQKIKKLGLDTAKVTGKAIKTTIEASGEVIDTVISKPIKKAVEATKDVFDEEKEPIPKEESPKKSEGQ